MYCYKKNDLLCLLKNRLNDIYWIEVDLEGGYHFVVFLSNEHKSYRLRYDDGIIEEIKKHFVNYESDPRSAGIFETYINENNLNKLSSIKKYQDDEDLNYYLKFKNIDREVYINKLNDDLYNKCKLKIKLKDF